VRGALAALAVGILAAFLRLSESVWFLRGFLMVSGFGAAGFLALGMAF